MLETQVLEKKIQDLKGQQQEVAVAQVRIDKDRLRLYRQQEHQCRQRSKRNAKRSSSS